MYMGVKMKEETKIDPSIQYLLIGKMREGWINSERWVFDFRYVQLDMIAGHPDRKL